MQYQLPYNAHSYYIDTTRKELLLLLKVEKEISLSTPYQVMLFDLDKNNVKWTANSNTPNIYITAPYIFTSGNGNTRCYRRSDGKQMWSKMDATIKYIDERKGVLLTDYIRGLNMHTGKTMWQRYLPGKYNWEDIKVVDDSSLIFVAGGIYKVNLYTGKGWSANDITSKNEFVPADAIGIIPQTPHYPLVSVPEIDNIPAVWRTTTSGILVSDNTLYVATNKRILSLDKETGKQLWQTLLPENTGITSLYLHDNKLLLLNEGKIASTSGIEKKYGIAYVCVLEKETGLPGKTYTIPSNGPINEIKTYDGKIMMLSFNAINIYDIPTNRIYTFPTAGDNRHVLEDERYYIKDEGGNRMITTNDCCFIYNSEQGIFNIDKNFFSIRNMEKDQVSSVDIYGKMQLFYNGANSIYNGNKHLIQTPASNKGFIVKNNLYIIDANTLSVIPVAEPK
jgi:outer membrane protein assembly factor BamB